MRKRNYWCYLLALLINVPMAHAQGGPLVEVVTIELSTLQPTLEAAGTFKAEHGVTLRSEIPGKIEQVFFNSGVAVKKGQKLVQLNQKILTAQLNIYEADLKLSQLEFERAEKLHQRNLMSKADFDKATAKINVAQARVDGAKARLAQTTIRAPFDGRLGLKHIDVGDYLNSGDKIVDIEDNDPILVDFNIAETALSKVNIGQNVIVHSDSAAGKTFKGKIVARDITANPQTRSISVRAQVPNPNWELLPGTFADITIVLASKKNVIQVPLTAVNYTKQNNYVYRVVDGKAKKTIVELGKADNKMVLITTGLKKGEQVITIGVDKVRDGVPVTIKNNKKNK